MYCYVLLWTIYNFMENQRMDNLKNNFDLQRIIYFHGFLRVSASCDELFTDTSELFTDACDWPVVENP